MAMAMKLDRLREPHGWSCTSDRMTTWTARANDLRAELESAERFREQMGHDIAPDWPPSMWTREFISKRLKCIEGSPVEFMWRPWYVRLRGINGPIVAAAWFDGPPGRDGSAELFFSVVRSHQGVGIATEGVSLMLAWPAERRWAKTCLARVGSADPAWGAVLKTNGFAPEKSHGPDALWAKPLRPRGLPAGEARPDCGGAISGGGAAAG